MALLFSKAHSDTGDRLKQTMKINSSYLFAGGAILAIGLWFFVNSKKDADTPPRQPTTVTVETTVPTVVYELREAEQHQNKFELFGRTEANREVSITAKTAGIVDKIAVKKGQRVAKGTLICHQELASRQAVYDQAQAALKARQADLNATLTLVEKGYKSAVQLDVDRAAVDGAKAGLKQADVELNNVNMKAPFAGIFDEQNVEIGDFLGPGQSCGNLVELNPLIVAIDLTENQVGFIKSGQEASVKLVTGETVSGKVRFIESKANSSTRTFRTEIAVPNPKYALKGGVTATVEIKTGTTLAQNIPSKILTLDNDGTVGVRYLDFDDIVRFTPVKTIDEDSNGIWVTGLPESTRIITQGQDFVAVGTKTNPKLTGQIQN